MVNHVWGLLTHPRQELQQIKREGESIPHLYTHHVLLLAAIPVICAFIGTTQVGWRFGKRSGYQAGYTYCALLCGYFLHPDTGGSRPYGAGHLPVGSPLCQPPQLATLYSVRGLCCNANVP